MPEDEKAVEVGFFTAPEFKRWGAMLNHVYPVAKGDQFMELLTAIEEADDERRRLR